MIKPLLVFFFSFAALTVLAQDHGFKFGEISKADLALKTYAKDTTANAVVLDEFGDTWIDSENDNNLLHEYHVRIKIFNSKAFDQANISIPLHKQEGKLERVFKIEASTFNLVDNKVQESKFDSKKVFTENKSKYYDLTKFTLPNVREGSIIEIRYRLESPFLFNFRPWEFQSDIPKMHSEYWARIPGNYIYNITYKGFYKLAFSTSEIVKDCFMPGGGNKADCALYKYGLNDIPAFEEEDYMTARSNFLAALNFELSEVKLFSGSTNKLTKTWRDVDQELRTDSKFGAQLRRGKDLFKDNLVVSLASVSDSLEKAHKIYNYIKSAYKWNEVYGKYSEFGIKKAFDSKVGNVGDINLSLIAALNQAGFTAEPVILSTRANGLPTDLHPVISDFNYVVARVKIKDKVYLLDATDSFLPFGALPIRCLNGKGRVIPTKAASYWLDIVPTEKMKQTTIMNIALQPDGTFKGKLTNVSHGYDALSDRKTISSHNNQDEYIEELDEKWNKIKIKKYEITNLENLDLPLNQTYEVEIEGFDNLNKNKLLLNPFFTQVWDKNPFTAKERLYPVDLGAPLETNLVVNLEYPTEFEPVNLPKPLLLTLPNNAGRYVFSVENLGNKIILNSVVSLKKPIYSAEEYHYLKELFSKIIESYKTSLVFNKKT